MHELRLLVEVGGVVLVALDDEIFTVGDAKARVEVLNDASHEKARIQSADLAHPCSDARRRCLAMRPCNDKRPAAADEFFFYDLGLRPIEKLAIQNLFQLRVTT